MALEERSPSDWHQPGGQKCSAARGNYDPFLLIPFAYLKSYIQYMDEDSLKKIHIGILHTMLIEKTKELINLKSKKDKADFHIKTIEIDLLQKVIATRSLEFPPN